MKNTLKILWYLSTITLFTCFIYGYYTKKDIKKEVQKKEIDTIVSLSKKLGMQQYRNAWLEENHDAVVGKRGVDLGRVDYNAGLSEKLPEIVLRRTDNVPNDFNNPLAIRVGNNDKINRYAIGWCWTNDSLNGKFLVFPTPQAGFFAGIELLTDYDSSAFGPFFRDFAPVIENETHEYMMKVCKEIGADTSDFVVDYKYQLLPILAKHEGFNKY